MLCVYIQVYTYLQCVQLQYRAPYLLSLYTHSMVWTYGWMTVCMKQTMILIGWNDCQGEGVMAHNSLQVA